MVVPVWRAPGRTASKTAGTGQGAWQMYITCSKKFEVPCLPNTRPSFVRHTMLRNNISGPEIGLPGQMSVGFQSVKLQVRPSSPFSASLKTDFDGCPAQKQAEIQLGAAGKGHPFPAVPGGRRRWMRQRDSSNGRAQAAAPLAPTGEPDAAGAAPPVTAASSPGSLAGGQGGSSSGGQTKSIISGPV